MQSDPAAHASGVEVIYADDAIIVLNKPSGLLSVPGRGADKQDCLSGRAARVFPDALVVHRLDMATSGLIVMARGAAVQRRLNEAFATRQVQKKYLAIVFGKFCTSPQSWQTIDLPIQLDWPNRPLRVINALTGKPSTTRVRNIEFLEKWGATRVELEPVTGRSHQLRVHLQAIGHPIIGDALYAPAAVHAMSDRLLLHAQQLQFSHPITGDKVAFECPVAFQFGTAPKIAG
jgi:tRNA pseudouridine32 synthase/23S rRNA pseudouridine746 synthase